VIIRDKLWLTANKKSLDEEKVSQHELTVILLISSRLLWYPTCLLRSILLLNATMLMRRLLGLFKRRFDGYMSDLRLMIYD
jgi:hypothetical protein